MTARTRPPAGATLRARRPVFADRVEAGRRLALALRPLLETSPGGDPVLVGMARGGVPVARQLASVFGAPLDVAVVRKLGRPGQPELGLGAIGEEGVHIVNTSLLSRLGLPGGVVDDVAAVEQVELDRRVALYRGGRPPVALGGRHVVVVDDGLATGFTARAAVETVRRRGAGRVTVAVPVGSTDAVASLRSVADDVVCVETSARFLGLSQWYGDFTQLTDDEVTRLLARPEPSRPGRF